jgi:hypothetical protein
MRRLHLLPALVFGSETLARSVGNDLRGRDAANSVKRRALRGWIACPACAKVRQDRVGLILLQNEPEFPRGRRPRDPVGVTPTPAIAASIAA